MKIEQFVCEICGQSFGSREAVGNEVAIKNGEYNKVYNDVCYECVEAMANFAKSLKIVKEE